MRVLLPVLVSLLALSSASARAGDEAKKKAELKWARSVADDFLAALKAEDYKSASALLTGEYAKILQGSSVPAAVPEALQGKLRGDIVKVTTSSEDISPDKDEAQLKGQVERATETQAFVLRVVKEKESGRWRVGFLQVDKAQAKPKEPKK
jgi:hypothetical protein